MDPSRRRREQIKRELRERLREYYAQEVGAFDPARDPLPLSSPAYDGDDVFEALEALLDGWPTLGPRVRAVEDKVAGLLGVKNAIMVSSGAAANHLVLQLLASPHADPVARLRPGDEILTPAVTWPTTVTAIVQAGFIPVLLDVEPDTHALDPLAIEAQLGERSRAVLLVHPFGHGCEMDAVLRIARQKKLLVIEDTCESIGARYRGRCLGSHGDFGTLSFYFSHQVTSVEGGMILTGDERHADLLRSMRANGWSRELRDASHRARLEREAGELDPSFLFSYTGFNFKPSDVAAGLLLGQLDRLEALIEARRAASAALAEGLSDLTEWLQLPGERPDHRSSAFCFPMLLKENVAATNRDMIRFLRERRVDARPLIGGNIAEQPFMRHVPHRKGGLPNAERVMRRGLFVGLHHRLDPPRIAYMADCIRKFVEEHLPSGPRA